MDAKHPYALLSALLQYPEPELLAALAELSALVAGEAGVRAPLRPLFDYLGSTRLIELQQNYVGTFDRSPAHSLHLFEHIHGESRDRGQAMVDLMEEYKKHGMQMRGDDLPDYVPLFLEFLGQQDEAEAARLLGDAIHVLAHIGNKLEAVGSPYAGIFRLLRGLSPVRAEALTEPPVRDMDEALETFGPGADGVEPLLRQTGAAGTHPIQFYPRARSAPAGS